MEWFYPKRRGPEWKQGWKGQTIASISVPSIHLLTVFAIVLILLWFSQFTNYKAQLHHTAINFQLLIFLLPVLLILLMASYSNVGSYSFRVPCLQAGGSPWGVASLVVLVLVLLSYQSSFHSKWFGPLRRSD